MRKVQLVEKNLCVRISSDLVPSKCHRFRLKPCSETDFRLQLYRGSPLEKNTQLSVARLKENINDMFVLKSLLDPSESVLP